MRQRIEDLGRLAEKIGDLLDHEVFDSINAHNESFALLCKDEDKVETLYYQLRYLKDELCEAWCIARYGDDDDEDFDHGH